jgi:nitroreductase/NAD-dependent dihydropyrimidine dehydrogenase PreA subunit
MGVLTIDEGKCNRDGICVAECPALIIRRETKESTPRPVPDFEELCLKCGHCVAVCPSGALRLDWLGPEDCPPLKKELALTPEQAEQFLRGRRSIRTFKRERVPREVLKKLLEVACSAPSARNMQPWQWVVVEDPAEVRRLAGMVIDWMRAVMREDPATAEMRGFHRAIASWDEGHERICREAPHVIVAHAEKSWGFGAEDCALALGLLDLYATSIGLGACWGGYFYSATNAYPPLFEALGLPADHRACGAMMIGYPTFRYQRIPLRNEAVVNWK